MMATNTHRPLKARPSAQKISQEAKYLFFIANVENERAYM